MLYDASSFINVSVRSMFTRRRRRRREHRTPLHKKWRVRARYSHSIISITADCVKSNYNFSKKYALWIFVYSSDIITCTKEMRSWYTKKKISDVFKFVQTVRCDAHFRLEYRLTNI